jgi:FtsH-binding integral membrane protein
MLDLLVDAITQFPADRVPDGDVFAPHHLWLGLIGLLLGAAMAWDDQQADPALTVGGAALTAFSFGFVWPYYATVGALGTLLGLAASAIGLTTESGLFRRSHMAVAAVGLAIAVDDAVEHAVGISTPLDVLFNEVLLPIILAIEAAA